MLNPNLASLILQMHASDDGLDPLMWIAAALPFESNTFDAVVMADVLEHLPDLRGALVRDLCPDFPADWVNFPNLES